MKRWALVVLLLALFALGMSCSGAGHDGGDTADDGGSDDNIEGKSSTSDELPRDSEISLNLLEKYETDCERFKRIEIGNKIVYWYQRMIDEAIVEKDQIVYQFDKETGELVKKTVHWRDDLPEHLPRLLVTREQAEQMAGAEGEVLSSRLYYISPESDVFPIKPTPKNPCWVVKIRGECGIALMVIDAVTGKRLGYGVPPPSSGFSFSGPWDENPCSGSWFGWYVNAEYWFEQMGYPTDAMKWPSRETVKSYIQNNDVSLFYEVAHGSSYLFCSGCSNDHFECVWASDIRSWISGYRKMPFTFIASCDGMCHTGYGTLSYEFRKGSSDDCATVGYCGMGEDHCLTCWSYSVSWQDHLFEYMSQGYTVKDAFDQANADYPTCADNNCMRFAGDPDFAVIISVDLGDFYAEASDGEIVVGWRTSREKNNAGWNLYRSADGGGYARLNDALIEPYQYDYEYIDADVEAGVSYCYKLEAVELDGSTREFGPECVVFGSLDGDTADVPDAAGDEALSATGGCGWW